MIKNLFAEKKQLLSFEVFPPKKEDEFANAFAVLDSLAGLQPDFISVTYGAGGSKSKKTVEIASYIQNQLHIMALAHMTCVGSKKEDIDAVTAQLKEVHVNHVLALRGDRPSYMSDEQFDSRHFSHAADLITYLKGETDLHIAGACYPEKHYEAADLESDLLHLKEKCDAGAEFLITQLFLIMKLSINSWKKAGMPESRFPSAPESCPLLPPNSWEPRFPCPVQPFPNSWRISLPPMVIILRI